MAGFGTQGMGRQVESWLGVSGAGLEKWQQRRQVMILEHGEKRVIKSLNIKTKSKS